MSHGILNGFEQVLPNWN